MEKVKRLVFYPLCYNRFYMETNETNKYFLPVAVVVAGLFIAGAVMWNGSRPAGTDTDSIGSPQAAPKADIKDVKTGGLPFIGSPNAPVVIAYWSDYQCPFCKKFDTESLPLITQDYVNTGKVKVVFKDFAFLGPDSTTAALYSRAVWELYPEKYRQWNEAMFVAQDEEHGGFGNDATVKQLTATISGIDANKVAQAIETNKVKYQTAIDADRAEAGAFGINATPSFIIGTEVIQGAYPYPTFQAAIDAALK